MLDGSEGCWCLIQDVLPPTLSQPTSPHSLCVRALQRVKRKADAAEAAAAGSISAVGELVDIQEYRTAIYALQPASRLPVRP